jgi:hypothetical protein
MSAKIKMEEECFSETLVNTRQVTKFSNPEDHNPKYFVFISLNIHHIKKCFRLNLWIVIKFISYVIFIMILHIM